MDVDAPFQYPSPPDNHVPLCVFIVTLVIARRHEKSGVADPPLKARIDIPKFRAPKFIPSAFCGQYAER